MNEMPCITLKTNQSVSKEKELLLKEDFGKAIALIPNKSERWLMCIFEDSVRLWLSGTDAPAAIAEVSLFGIASAQAYGLLTESLSESIAKQLAVSPERIYIQYAQTPYWGWNGKNL